MKLLILLAMILLISGCLFQEPGDCNRILVYNEKNEDCISICEENFQNWETNYKIIDKCPIPIVLDECTCECVKKGQTIKELYFQSHGTYPECGADCSTKDISKKNCESMGGE